MVPTLPVSGKHSRQHRHSDSSFLAGTIPSGIAGGDASATTSGAASGAASSGASGSSGSTSGAMSLFSSTTGTFGAAAAVLVGLVSGGLAVAL